MACQTVTLIGLGGVGGCVARALPQTLAWAHVPGTRFAVNLVDDDTFEPNNAARQTFHREGPKADVVCEALIAAYQPNDANGLPPIRFTAKVERITPENVPAHVVSGSVILLAVDDHYVRRVVSEYASGLSEIIIISGSNNELTQGVVQLYARSEGKDLTLPLHSAYHPEIAQATNQKQLTHGCGMRFEDPQSTQLFVVNNRVAATMMEVLHRILALTTVTSLPDEVRLDVKTLAQRPVTLRQI